MVLLIIGTNDIQKQICYVENNKEYDWYVDKMRKNLVISYLAGKLEAKF